MTNEKLKQIFDENADCYFTMEMQSAMTESKFIEVVSELMDDTWIEIKSDDDLPKDDSIHYWAIAPNGTMFDFTFNLDTIIAKYKNGTITHYLPIHKPNPPKP